MLLFDSAYYQDVTTTSHLNTDSRFYNMINFIIRA